MQSPSINSGVALLPILQIFCDSLEESVAIVNSSTLEILYANSSMQRMLAPGSPAGSRSALELLKLRTSPAISDEDESLLSIAIQKGVYTEQAEFCSTDHAVQFSGELSVRYAKEGDEAYYLFTIARTDISAPGNTQKALDRQRSTALLEHASMGIIEANEKGEIINVNPFALKLFGYEKGEVVGQKIELLIPSRFHAKHVKNREDYLLHTRNRPMGVGMDLYAVKKDGQEFPVEVSLSSYHHNVAKHVIAFVSDISIRKQAELEIIKLNDHLEQTVEQRTQELINANTELNRSKEELSRALENEKELNDLKSKFVSMASHEFRTPLSTILSSSYLLQKYTTTEDQSKREKHLQRIISSVNMLTDILNDFLSVGKIEEGKIHVRLSQFDMEELISSTLEEIQHNFRKQQNIHYSHKGNGLVLLDTSLFKHILLNLVSNACKFSPENSAIIVTSEASEQDIVLSVKDEGMGISAEDQQHLMERFFRGANAANIQGTGLGLHIVAKYSELLDGKVECKSELKQGTEFRITFKKKHHEEDFAH
jgi:PAS domain S-box-containing protein